jgi:hypothetical protein
MTIDEMFLGSLPLILGVALAVFARKRGWLRGIEWILASAVVLLGCLYLMKAIAPVLRHPSQGLIPVSPVSHGGGWSWLVTNGINLFAENFSNYGWPLMLADVAIGAAVGWGVSVFSRK